jgi:hypothetical protein
VFRRPVVLAAILTISLRILYSAVAGIASLWLQIDPLLVRSNDLTQNLIQPSQGLRYALWGLWERFDTLWYVNIGLHGYAWPQAVVFYPGYPFLIKLATPVVREPIAAALLISTAATFCLFWGLQKLLALDLPSDTVRRSLILYAAWPAGFILFAGYPESLVAALAVWSLYYARTGRWWLAGMAGAAASMVKATGMLVAVPLFLLARGRKDNSRWIPLLCLAGPLAYMVFLNASGVGSLSDIYARYWRTQLAFPWETLLESFASMVVRQDIRILLNFAALILFFWLTFRRRWRPEYTAFSIAALCLFLTKRTEPVLLESTLRYLLFVFPAFAVLAGMLRKRAGFAFVTGAFFSLNLALFLLFLQWALLV